MNLSARAHTEQLASHSITRLLLRYSIPATVGSLMFTLYNLVDRIFIGQAMGSNAVAGIGITMPLFIICISIGMMIGIGGGTLASLKLGARHYDEAEKILGTMVVMFSSLGCLAGFLGIMFIKPLLYLFGASDATFPYAYEYMIVLLWFIPFDFLAMGTNTILRSEGSPKFSMWNLTIGCLTNVVLDYLFIFPLDMGIKGAALATGLSKMLSTILMFWHFTRSRHRTLTLRKRNLHIEWPLVLPMLTIGLSPFILQFVSAIVIVLTNRSLLEYGGDDAIGAMTAITGIGMVLGMPAMGIMMGVQPILGYNYGAKQFDRVAETLKTALLLSCAITIVMLLPAMFFTAELLSLFGKDSSGMIEIGIHGLRIYFALLPLAAMQIIGSNYFQAIGRPKISITLNLLRQLVCFLPLLFLLPVFFRLDGIWLASPLTDLLGTAVTAIFIYHEFRRLKNIAAAEQLTVQ